MVTRERWFCVPISRRANRLVHGSIAVALAAGLGLCTIIEPDPSGTGTHTQLGLPDCLICRITGLQRCPSCGLTTGLAHLVRGQWNQAVAVHSASPIVLTIWCGILVYCVTVAALGINWLAQEIFVFAILCVLGLVSWLCSLYHEVVG